MTKHASELKMPQPVAWGVPNSRPTERQPMMMLLHSTKGCQYPDQLVALYAEPDILPRLREADAILKELVESADALDAAYRAPGLIEPEAEEARCIAAWSRARTYADKYMNADAKEGSDA